MNSSTSRRPGWDTARLAYLRRCLAELEGLLMQIDAGKTSPESSLPWLFTKHGGSYGRVETTPAVFRVKCAGVTGQCAMHRSSAPERVAVGRWRNNAEGILLLHEHMNGTERGRP